MPNASTKEYKIALRANDQRINADVIVYVREWQDQGRHRDCTVTVKWHGNEVSNTSRSVYHAFREVRRELETKNLQADCYGACEDVQASGMVLDMGDGSDAYRMSLAENGVRPPLVNIFDSEPDLVIHSVSDQEQYMEKRFQKP